MPWCEHCAKFWTPSSMKADGSCPTCGRTLPVAGPPGETQLTAKDVNLREMAGEDAKAPWHFKLLMVLVALYLGWRVVQLVGMAF
jgi:hypothetical protein